MTSRTTHRSNARPAALALALILPLALAACDRAAPSGPVARADASPAWILAQAPEGAISITEAKALPEGEPVVVRARIGGRRDPMTAGTPVLVVMDTAIPSCAENPEDECPTPWDYCCEPKDVLAANGATVQLVDASGAPLKADPAAAGLEPLDEIIIVGSIAPAPAEGVLLIRATAIHPLRG